MSTQSQCFRLKDFYECETYAAKKRYFELFYRYERDPPMVVDMRSMQSFPPRKTIFHQFSNSGAYKPVLAFLRDWLEEIQIETTFEKEFDLDTARVVNSVKVEPLELTATTAACETVQSKAIVLGYDLSNLRRLMSRAAVDFIFPNFRKGAKVFRAIALLQLASDVIWMCDDAICHQIPALETHIVLDGLLGEITPIGSDPGAPERRERRVAVTGIFRDHLLHPSLRPSYDPAHPKRTPLSNRLSIVAQDYLTLLLDRYQQLLDRVETFLRETKWHKNAAKRLRDLRNAIRTLRCETQWAPLVHQYRARVFCGYTNATLLAMPIEELRATVADLADYVPLTNPLAAY